MTSRLLVLPVALSLLIGGCASKGEIDETGGITAVRSACPAVGIPAQTGDITQFNPPEARTEDAIDVVALMTDVRSTCSDAGDQILTSITFQVRARRADTTAARDVTLPYFITVVRGGNQVTAKRVGQVTVHFDAGQARSAVAGQASTLISRAAATLPDSVRRRLLEKRKAGDADAAIDPLSRPDVRTAVERATFEALVGFQLTPDQLRYNATR